MLNQLIEQLQTNVWFFYTVIIFLGLTVGSFLNVIIYRLPVMLDREWTQQCHDYLQHDATDTETRAEKFNLSYPPSTCPQCQHKIRAWENIPVISYIMLGGKCSHCKTSISIQYPLVETVTAILSVFVAWHFGATAQTMAALILTWSLVALTMIDAQKQILPDNITQPLLWLGIIVNIPELFTSIESSVTGAIAGYLILWFIYHLFRILTGKEGMGYGDFKLLAALGAWMGWEMLPLIIVLSSVVGAIIGIAMIVFRKHDKGVPIPFGPYLAIAGWIAFLWGPQITRAWLG